MNERQLLHLIIFTFVYYGIQFFVLSQYRDVKPQENAVNTVASVKNNIPPPKIKKETKSIPLHIKDGCSVLDVFTKKGTIKKENIKGKEIELENNSIAVIGIMVFLLILLINAMLDILKVKEEERLRMKLNPDGIRRKSLSEFANKKSLRRESSKFGLQLFQIAESVMGKGEDRTTHRESRSYTRGDSINSYLSDKKPSSDSAPPSVGETPTDVHVTKRQSVAKLFGARPPPMVRRSSFPALPLNPEIQALMLGGRQPSFDSDDEDGKGRRVRIIRRY